MDFFNQDKNEPNWDRFEPFVWMKKQNFVFVPKSYKIWKEGRIVKQGETKHPIYAIEIDATEETTKYRVTIYDPTLHTEIQYMCVFDDFISAVDRLQMITIPEFTQTENTAISLFRDLIGATCKTKEFEYNTPYCCNMFMINKIIKRLTFSFSNPDKLIEFDS